MCINSPQWKLGAIHKPHSSAVAFKVVRYVFCSVLLISTSCLQDSGLQIRVLNEMSSDGNITLWWELSTSLW